MSLHLDFTFDVSRRTKELGIRIALGVSAGRLMQLVFSGGLRPIVLGVALGALVSAVAAQSVQPLLYSTSARDPFVYAVVPVCLMVAACIAIAVPAMRVTRISPANALRAE